MEKYYRYAIWALAVIMLADVGKNVQEFFMNRGKIYPEHISLGQSLCAGNQGLLYLDDSESRVVSNKDTMKDDTVYVTDVYCINGAQFRNVKTKTPHLVEAAP